MNKNIAKITGSILLCLAAGIIGGLITAPAIPAWYNGLNKPFFNPPPWIFGPVWTLLYILMGIALFLIWDKKGSGTIKQKSLVCFFIQLFLNAIWSPIFFGLHAPLAAFIVIVFLWIAILMTMTGFRKISKTAFWLLVPYLLWVSFASVLNFAIWQLNP
jgi:tryptophan-rich sensory protein